MDTAPARAVCVLVLSAAAIAVTGGRINPHEGRKWTVEEDNKLHAFVRSLPDDAYLAGWPPLVMTIPQACRRPVFISLQTHLPYHTEFTKEMRRRMYALIDAQYAASVEPLLKLRDEHGVTHLLVHRHHLRSHIPGNYFRPFDEYIEKRFDEAQRSYEIFRQIPHAEVFSWSKLTLLDLSKLAVSNRPQD